ncbi:unnamed protein product [Discosporangium mesarthrocarpum]
MPMPPVHPRRGMTVAVCTILVLGFVLVRLPVDQKTYSRDSAGRWRGVSSKPALRPDGSLNGGMVRLSDLAVEAVNHEGGGISKQVMVINGQVPHLTGFSRAVFKPGQSVGIHKHKDMDEVFFVQEGRGIFVVEEVVLQATPGTCVHVAAGQTHDISNTGKEDMVVLYFGIALST